MACWILASRPNPDWWRSILALLVLGVDHNLWASACPLAFWGLTTGSLWDWDPGSCLATDPKFQCNNLRATSLSLLLCDTVLHHAGKCTDHRTAHGLLEEVSLAGRFDTILYSWQCFWAELWESPLPWLKSNPTHGWSQDASLLARHRTHGSVHLFFSEQSIFQMSQTVRRELQRK